MGAVDYIRGCTPRRISGRILVPQRAEFIVRANEIVRAKKFIDTEIGGDCVNGLLTESVYTAVGSEEICELLLCVFGNIDNFLVVPCGRINNCDIPKRKGNRLIGNQPQIK